ncbi:MAG: phosphate regulon transcriptional regulator PhoB [Alphaproteobacteria bacterium]|nr:phosphate regulon transcriptional regulator PhoB [Alphaproteobacteria bacterium]
MDSLVLIVEGEVPQAEFLRFNLEHNGFRVHAATTAEEAIQRIEEEVPDIIILDWTLSDSSGPELCEHLRGQGQTRAVPIIMLADRANEADKIRGLDAGADDYVVKPYSPKELVARARAVLRRAGVEPEREKISYAGVSLDPDTHRVTRNGRHIHLGPTEFRLLRRLMERPGRVYSRRHLLDDVWGPASNIELRTIDVHIRRLRQALNSDQAPDLIRTVRGVGYAIDAEAR